MTFDSRRPPLSQHRPIEPLEGRVLLSGNPHRDNDRDDDGKGSQLSTDPAMTVVADFTGDDKADVIAVARVPDPKKNPKAQGPKRDALTLLTGKGNGTFDAGRALDVDVSGADRILAADFNADGNPDLAVVDGSEVSVYTGNGAGGLASTPIVSDLGVNLPSGVTVGAADITGDKAADLVAFNASDVWVALNDGTGELLPAVQQSNPFGTAIPVALGDLDNDGRADLLGVEGSTGLLVNKARASTGEFMLSYLPELATTIPLADKRIVIADVNGDMANDVIAIGRDAVWVALQQFDSTELTSLAPWVKTDADLDPAKVLVGDVNGDGRADLFELAGGKKQAHRATLVLTGTEDGTFHKLIIDDNGDDGDDDDDGDGDGDGKGKGKGRGLGHQKGKHGGKHGDRDD